MTENLYSITDDVDETCMTLDEASKCMSLDEACVYFKTSSQTIRKECKKFGIKRWPIKKNNLLPTKTPSKKEIILYSIDHTLKEACVHFNMSEAKLKAICRKYKIIRWPHDPIVKMLNIIHDCKNLNTQMFLISEYLRIFL
tara:strand:- start:230 stop:652 length:423 start_codon:yes stop_codon:yes gene_type:complete